MTSPYAGSTTPPPGAGRRTETSGHTSAMREGGLLARGTRVEVDYPYGTDVVVFSGEIVDIGSVPAPHVLLTGCGTLGGDLVLFLGPGVSIRRSTPD